MAIPANVFALLPPLTVSVLSLKDALNRLVTITEVDEAESSSAAVTVADPDATGASFSAVTLWLNTTVALLYAVEPPRVETSNVAFVVTVVGLSIRIAVSDGAAPLKLAAGKKRR